MSALIQVRPIVAALRRHKSAVLLLILEIALTLAVLGNLIFIVQGGLQRSHTPSGVVEGDIGVIQSISVVGYANPGTVNNDLALLKSVPDVVDAAYGGPPLWFVERDKMFLSPGRQKQAAQAYEFQGSQGLDRTLGVRVLEGRALNDDEVPVMGKMDEHTQFPVLITRSLAAHLYPDASALGQLLYDGNASLRVVGVIDDLRGEITGAADDAYGLVIEYSMGSSDGGGGFMIRSRPGQLNHTLQAAATALQKANPGHVQGEVFGMSELRAKYFRSDRSLGRMLIAIMLILLVVTALGVSGLASFWVQQRTRQIGMRRALGATRGDILRYFQIENLLIVSAGVVLGAVCAYALNLFLMQRFEIALLPFGYLLVGAAVLWMLGQLAVLGPALRAAAVPPVVATRSV
jgi:putative ABC transport system permease protein